MPLAWAGVGRREALQVGQQVSEEERIRRTVTEAYLLWTGKSPMDFLDLPFLRVQMVF